MPPEMPNNRQTDIVDKDFIIHEVEDSMHILEKREEWKKSHDEVLIVFKE